MNDEIMRQLSFVLGAYGVSLMVVAGLLFSLLSVRIKTMKKIQQLEYKLSKTGAPPK